MKSHKTTAVAEVNEFRKDLIAYFNNQALGQRTQAAIANRRYISDKHLAKAETYEMMVKFLREIEVIDQVSGMGAMTAHH